jgi:hypothetical protein
MIKNFKDIVVLLITTGVLILLGTIIIEEITLSPLKKIVPSMRVSSRYT